MSIKIKGLIIEILTAVKISIFDRHIKAIKIYPAAPLFN